MPQAQWVYCYLMAGLTVSLFPVLQTKPMAEVQNRASSLSWWRLIVPYAGAHRSLWCLTVDGVLIQLQNHVSWATRSEYFLFYLFLFLIDPKWDKDFFYGKRRVVYTSVIRPLKCLLTHFWHFCRLQVSASRWADHCSCAFHHGYNGRLL